jgi:MFS family permease
VLVSVIVLGLAGGVINGGSNALINDLHPSRRAAALNFLGIFFGIGAMLIPLIIGSFLHQLGSARSSCWPRDSVLFLLFFFLFFISPGRNSLRAFL